MVHTDRIRVVAADATSALAARVAAHVGASGSGRDVWFASGEGKYVLGDDVRGRDVYVVLEPVVPDSPRSVYDRFLMALHAADAARTCDAARVVLVTPYFPGARQDKRKDRAREGVSTGLFARVIEAAGVSMVVTVEAHSAAIAGCFEPSRCVFEDLSVHHAIAPWLRERVDIDLVASTDVGGLERARRFARALGAGLAAISKERDYTTVNQVRQATVLGEVAGRNVLIVDDIIDTGRTIGAAAHALWDAGARDITALGVHPVLSPAARDCLAGLCAEADARGVRLRVLGTTSVPVVDPPAVYEAWDLAPLLGDVIRAVSARASVSAVLGGPS